MTADHTGPGSGIEPGPYYLAGRGYEVSLGLAVCRTGGIAATPGTPGDHNRDGVGGTAFWVDPGEGLSVVLMPITRSVTVYHPRAPAR